MHRKDEKGPSGLTTTSTFVGRVFTHTGVPGGTQETYSNNFVFDTVEDQFTGIATNFILKSAGAECNWICNKYRCNSSK